MPQHRAESEREAEPETAPAPSFAIPLAAIAAIAFAIRLTDTLRYRPQKFIGDPRYYHVQANLIADGHGFASPTAWLNGGHIVPTAFHPPLFPLVLSITSFLGGTSVRAHQITACCIGTATVVLVGLIGKAVGGRRAGLVAAGLAAVYPNLWLLDGRLWSETLAACMVALSILCAYRLHRSGSWPWLVALGVSIALASLTRPETLLLLPLVAAPVIWTRRETPRARRLLQIGVVCVVSAIVVAPWLIRNLTGFDRPVTFSTNGDEVLGIANCAPTYSGPLIGYWTIACAGSGPTSDEARYTEAGRKQGIDYIKHHEARFVSAVLWARVGRVWDVFRPFQNAHLDQGEGRSYSAGVAGLYAYWTMLPVAAIGLWMLRRRRAVPLSPLLGPFAVVTVVAVYAYGAVRFRAIAEPALLVLAAVALETLAVRAFAAMRRKPQNDQIIAATPPPAPSGEA